MPARQDSRVAHAVFFSLHDRSASCIQQLVAACQDNLDGHDGVQYFCVGERDEGFDRPVNDQDYDVALYLVFDDRAAHDAYQESPRHQEFIEQNKKNWANVRIFDSHLA